MRRLTLVPPAIFAVLALSIPLYAKEWRGITPLRSTRTDVERLFGRSADGRGAWAIYQTEEEGISILFASGPPCGSNAENEWRVPKGTVISISISPKTIILFSKLNIDESKYQKLADPHQLNRIEYWNKEEGESISVVDDEVSSFTYFGAAKDSMLHCPGSQLPESALSPEHYFRLDVYGDLVFRDEKARLDNFAIALQQGPTSRGYIIGYPAFRSSGSSTLARLNRARTYLVSVRGIEAKRLTRIRGGFRKQFTIELFIVPADAEAPSPLPLVSGRSNRVRGTNLH
jgi:hypothetical protein